MSTINIAISTDERGFEINATLIASILRRTARFVHVRCWCRGFLAKSFEIGPLKVEFLPAIEEVTGKFPGYVGPAVFDRLRVIQECEDWDRCLIMDYDQLVLCDLAPLMEMDLGNNLLAAKMQGSDVNMAYAMREWIKRPLPSGWEHVASYPYFSMGPLLNLKTMREAGTWDKLMAAHAVFGVDEQLSLTAATEGRTIGFDRKWNLFPKSDISGDDVPEGVIHWLGWPKPWHVGVDVWRSDIWFAEETSWEHLRMGIWRKPLAIEVEPEDDRAVKALATRGWRVKVFSSHFQDGGRGQHLTPAMPDVEVHAADVSAFQSTLKELGEEIDRVRISPWEEVADWLDGSEAAPKYLVLHGSMDAAETDRIRQLGYTSESRLMTGEWPLGGPLPRALDYHPCQAGTGIGAGEQLYFKMEKTVSNHHTRYSMGEKQAPQTLTNPKKIGVCIIATASYRMFIRPLLQSIRKNFLAGHEVTIFLFTDVDHPVAADLRVIPVTHSSWPGMAIRRYGIFTEHAKCFHGMDYLYYLDADMRVIGKVGDEIFGELVGTIHPGFCDKSREKFTYERRNTSTAWIAPHEGVHYFCGAFQGGLIEHYLEAARVMADHIHLDETQGITAVWHDESHWNRYLIDHPPSLILSPSYCWYPDGRSSTFEGKISVVLKDAAEMRKE